MPAKAGIQGGHGEVKTVKNWIPACAGKTEGEVDFQSVLSELLGLEPKVIQF